MAKGPTAAQVEAARTWLEDDDGPPTPGFVDILARAVLRWRDEVQGAGSTPAGRCDQAPGTDPGSPPPPPHAEPAGQSVYRAIAWEAHTLGRIYNQQGEPEKPAEVIARLDAMIARERRRSADDAEADQDQGAGSRQDPEPHAGPAGIHSPGSPPPPPPAEPELFECEECGGRRVVTTDIPCPACVLEDPSPPPPPPAEADDAEDPDFCVERPEPKRAGTVKVRLRRKTAEPEPVDGEALARILEAESHHEWAGVVRALAAERDGLSEANDANFADAAEQRARAEEAEAELAEVTGSTVGAALAFEARKDEIRALGKAKRKAEAEVGRLREACSRMRHDAGEYADQGMLRLVDVLSWISAALRGGEVSDE